MTDRATGQLNTSAADYYEEYFVPSLFKERTEPLLDLAGISAGDSILDVGCGTGILARDAWQRLDGSGSVIGIDRNDGMIATAQRVAPEIEWRIGQATSFRPFIAGSGQKSDSAPLGPRSKFGFESPLPFFDLPASSSVLPHHKLRHSPGRQLPRIPRETINQPDALDNPSPSTYPKPFHTITGVESPGSPGRSGISYPHGTPFHTRFRK